MQPNLATVAISELAKALEAGSYDAAPSSLTQGGSLQVEDLSSVMNMVTFQQEHLKLQKEIKVVPCKSTTAQFNRQLSVGDFGGSAATEGNIGPEETSDYVRVTVPMCYYSKVRRTSLASGMVETFDGKKSPERAAEDAAQSLAADFEFDGFRGLDDFSNVGVFDGHPMLQPALPNIHGLQLQIRQSDYMANSRDLMFAEYGSDDSVVLVAGGTLTQTLLEDVSLRSNLNFGTAKDLMVDPVVASAYNKITLGKERVIVANAPATATGSDLARQFVLGGTVNVQANQFLRGKSRPRRPRSSNLPSTAVAVAPASIALSPSAAGTSLTAGTYIYYATAQNEFNESTPCATQTTTPNAGDKVVVTITHPGSGTFRFFNVYRTSAGGPAASAKFIGKVLTTPNSGTTAFTDLNNKQPGYVTGVLMQKDTFEMAELASFSRVDLARTDLTEPEGFYRFATLKVMAPRKNVLLDNLRGQS
jgi:hypothetical protein